MKTQGNRAVFLDRDGVLNRDSPDFIKSPDEFDLLPGAPEAVARLNQAGFLCIVVTNQSGIARGLVTVRNLEAMNRKLIDAVKDAAGEIAAIYHCPHLPSDNCACRKPRTGMIREAATDFGIDLTRSFLVGDKPHDIQCGSDAGCTSILVLSGQTRTYSESDFDPPASHVAADLSAAADWILRGGKDAL